MPTRLTSALLLSLALTTSACSSSMKTPDIKQNPHPQQRYELTVTVDAPGPFESIKGYAFYEVRNVECVPHAPLTGGRSLPNTGRNFELTRMPNGTYHGYFYRDQLQDEDYFGLGVCHWDIVGVGPNFEVHGESFEPAMVLNDVLQQRSETRLFSRKEFADQTLRGTALQWRATDDEIVKHPEAYFPITITVKEAKP